MRAAREARSLSQGRLAERAKVSPTTLTRIETGLISARIETLRRLARALGVRPSELVAPLDELTNSR